jgi:hypothetical protein
MGSRSFSGSSVTNGTRSNSFSYATQVTATTATITNISGYRVYTFTGDGSIAFTGVPKKFPLTFNSVENLVIAGAGGGGTVYGGGGGAGGYRTTTTIW